MKHLLLSIIFVLSHCVVLKAESLDAKARHIIESILSQNEKNHWAISEWTDSEDSITIRLRSKPENNCVAFLDNLVVSIYQVSDDILEITDLFNTTTVKYWLPSQDHRIRNISWENSHEIIADMDVCSTRMPGIYRIVRRWVLDGHELISLSFEKWDDCMNTEPVSAWEEQRAYWLRRFCEVDVNSKAE